jgi:hypothetical protein
MRYLALLLIFTVAAPSLVISQVPEHQIKMERPFESDGCSRFPDLDVWDCCYAHDEQYYFGGSFKARRAADKALYSCVKSRRGKGHKLLATVMYLGVRLGAVSFLPLPFRWGFGNKFPRKEPERQKLKAVEPTTGR